MTRPIAVFRIEPYIFEVYRLSINGSTSHISINVKDSGYNNMDVIPYIGDEMSIAYWALRYTASRAVLNQTITIDAFN